jgi:hypothetical protein
VIAAPAHQRGMPHVQLEVVLPADTRDQRVELGRGNVTDAPAELAHQVPVRAREMEERRTMRPVHVLHEPPGVERLERSVHGGEVDLRVRAVNPVREVVGGQVLLGVREQLDDQPSRGGDASPVGA